jgi:hypothetical protein
MHKMLVTAVLTAALPFAVVAAEKGAGSEAKELSGMSVLGNNETPKALYIVPWKSSELGLEGDLRSGLMNDAMAPVDKEVFMRQLEFYEISAGQ